MTRKPERPKDARVHELTVMRKERVSSSFVRVTFGGSAPDFDAGFVARGYDQWFRLFLPNGSGALGLPDGTGDGWYRRWLRIPASRRSVVRNYTIRATRRVGERWEVDADFVVHTGPSGVVDGVAASWALAAEPGDRLGFLDQGMLFAPEDAARAAAAGGRVWLLADETGVPGVEAILRALPDGVQVTCVLEVPHDDDRRELATGADLELRWVVRGDVHEQPGLGVLEVAEGLPFGREDYVYAVGEASMATTIRKVARGARLRKEHIDFCAYWRPVRRAA